MRAFSVEVSRGESLTVRLVDGSFSQEFRVVVDDEGQFWVHPMNAAVVVEGVFEQRFALRRRRGG